VNLSSLNCFSQAIEKHPRSLPPFIKHSLFHSVIVLLNFIAFRTFEALKYITEIYTMGTTNSTLLPLFIL
jgi:hypothetical protein